MSRCSFGRITSPKVNALSRKGATAFVAGEVEAGLELLARTLRLLELPRNIISSEVSRAREETQESARPLTLSRTAYNFS